jgi:hypothetical protein
MMHPYKTGLALGGLAAGTHIIWSLIVALGWGQAWIDFVFSMHMLKPIVKVMPFDFGNAIGVIILAAIIGFVMGNVFAHIWNRIKDR